LLVRPTWAVDDGDNNNKSVRPTWAVDDDDDNNKSVWPTWAVGVLSGVRDVKSIQPRTPVLEVSREVSISTGGGTLDILFSGHKGSTNSIIIGSG
jgi:hypothetical protein